MTQATSDVSLGPIFVFAAFHLTPCHIFRGSQPVYAINISQYYQTMKNLLVAQTTSDASLGPVFILPPFHLTSCSLQFTTCRYQLVLINHKRKKKKKLRNGVNDVRHDVWASFHRLQLPPHSISCILQFTTCKYQLVVIIQRNKEENLLMARAA